MNQEQFDKWVDRLDPDTYIIAIKLRHTSDEPYEIIKELLYYDCELAMWVWDNDWNEGQKDVIYLGYIALDDIEEYNKF